MVHTNILKSSTIVRKYLWPWTNEIERDPHISKRSSSYLEETWDELILKGNFLCLAKWQMSQTAL